MPNRIDDFTNHFTRWLDDWKRDRWDQFRFADHGQELTAIPLSGQSSTVGDNGASVSTKTSSAEAPEFYRPRQLQCPFRDCDFIGSQGALEDHQLQVHDLPAATADDGYCEREEI